MAKSKQIIVNGARLWTSILDMARIGGTPKGGSRRLALTDDDKLGRTLFAGWCEDAGCTVKIDRMGSMFARRSGRNEELAPVLIGSHLDTQLTGGKFDGVLGVLGALEVVRTLNDFQVSTDRPIEVVNWSNEEGARFTPAMIASGVFAGLYTEEFAYGLTDQDGRSFGDELRRIGFQGSEPARLRPIHAAFELHIEQGPILENENVEIGVVVEGQGERWYEVTLTGREGHAGSTPMDSRKDALLGAARIIEHVNRIALENAPAGVATVGTIKAYPGSPNVIPGSVTFTVDLRHPSKRHHEAMDAAIQQGIESICATCGLTSTIRQMLSSSPIQFDQTCISAVRNAARKLGYTHRDITSGAGHDSFHLAGVAPTGMIFVPCVNGLSHNEEENIKPSWATAGTNVLLHAAMDKAGVVD